jgi:NADH-quinone oxidoreductase subunit L
MDQLVLLALVLAALPMVNFVLIMFNQRTLNDRAHLIATPTLAFSFVLSLYIAWMKLKGSPGQVITWSFDWIRLGLVPGSGPVTITQGVLIDNITVILLIVITLISLLVHFFSSEYMKNDVRYARYYAYLGLFTSSMLGLVLSSSLLGIFMFWELVGFASYALIGHWYERPAPQMAAIKAFLVNRIGDAAMWIGIVLLFAEFHTFDLRQIFGYINEGLPVTFSLFGLSPETTLTVTGILLFCGAIAKSGQLPLHVWLPDAMEGPTPVSALIHAATMVAAGVYLTARIFPILTAQSMLVVAIVGGLTSLYAAITAFTQTDIKRVLAYSTISQLGLMIMSIGSGAVAAGVFHLVTHAFFKAGLFLGAGAVIHSMHKAMHAAEDHSTDAQDICNMGGLIRRMPVTGWTFVVASLGLIGLPLLSGFLSKDEILAGVTSYGDLGRGTIAEWLPYVGFAVSFLTALYMGRLVFRVFFGSSCSSVLYDKIREVPRMMTIPLIALALLSVWLWYGKNPISPESSWALTKWIRTPGQVIPPQTAPNFRPHRTVLESAEDSHEIFGLNVVQGTPSVAESVTEPMPHQIALVQERHALGWWPAIIAFGAATLGLLIAWLVFLVRPQIAGAFSRWFRPVLRTIKRGLYIDTLYRFAITDSVILFSRMISWLDDHVIDGAVNALPKVAVLLSAIIGWLDRYVVDGIVNLVGATVQLVGLTARSVQTGRIQTYMFWAIVCVVLFAAVRYVMLVGV